MRLASSPSGWLGCLALLLVPAARADAPPDPLRLVPNQADFIVKVEQPRLLVESVTTLDLLKQLYQFDAVREQLDSTNTRRFFQLVGYFEKHLGAEWPELLDRLAGNGIVLAVQGGSEPAPTLFIVQGKDEKRIQKFMATALEVIEQELARQESKDRPQKGDYRKIETVKIGDNFHAARAGTALVVSNKEAFLHQSLDLHLDGSIRSVAGLVAVADARKLLPPGPLAWAWLNLETVLKQGREGLDALEANPAFSAVVGHLLSITRKSPFVCAGLYKQPDGFSATLRAPRGRDVIPGHIASGHLPPVDQVGTLPPLEPKGVLLSTSFYLDLAEFWKNRAKFLTEEQQGQADEFDKASAAFLAGNKLSEILAMTGTHHRLVVANQPATGYRTTPGQRLPSFAFVTTQRDPQFGKSMEAVLRAGAILAGKAVPVRLVEEKHAGVPIVGYRFAENAKVPQDAQNLRFNYTPCFASVGDQFVVSASLELCRELVVLLQQEAQDPSRKQGRPAASWTRVHSAGGAELLKAFEDQLLTQAILNRAVPPDEAGKEVQALIDWVRRLGTLELETNYGRKDSAFDVRLKLGK